MREKKRNLLNFFVTLFLLQLNEINSLCITTTRNPILNEAISTTLFKYNPPPSTHFLLQLGGPYGCQCDCDCGYGQVCTNNQCQATVSVGLTTALPANGKVLGEPCDCNCECRSGSCNQQKICFASYVTYFDINPNNNRSVLIKKYIYTW